MSHSPTVSAGTRQARAKTGSADHLVEDPASILRTSESRQQALQQYVEALIPADVDGTVDVAVSPAVSRAFVAPATEEALLSDDAPAIQKAEARQLIQETDGGYLVVVSGQAADLNAVHIDHQATVDKEFQFGLALHETLHILKTAVSGQTQLLEEQVDSQYQEFVDRLINTTEDGAIEHELRTGDDFSEFASTRITLTRQISDHQDTDSSVSCSLGDAISLALYELLIFQTGRLQTLLDPAQTAYQFDSEDTRAAFFDIFDNLHSLREDILALRSDSPRELYQDNKQASLKRAQRTIDFWKGIKPLVTADSDEDSTGSTEQQGPQGEQQSESETPTADTFDPDAVSIEPTTTDSPSQSPIDQPEVLEEPDADQLDTSAEEEGNEEEIVDTDAAAGDSTTTDTDAVGQPSAESHNTSPTETAGEQSTDGERNDECADSDNGPGDTTSTSEATSESDDGSGTGEQSDSPHTSPAPNQDRSDSHQNSDGDSSSSQSPSESPSASSSPPSSSSSPSSPSSSSSSSSSSAPSLVDALQQSTENDSSPDSSGEPAQLTLDDVGSGSDPSDPPRAPQSPSASSTESPDTTRESSESTAESSEPSESNAEAEHSQQQADQDEHSAQPEPDSSSDGSDGSSDGSSDEPSDAPADTPTDTSADTPIETPESPSPVEPAKPPTSEDTIDKDELQTDQSRMDRTLREEGPDVDALQDELDALDDALNDRDTTPSGNGGNGAGAGSLSELTVLPDATRSSADSLPDWNDITADADGVARTLAKELQLEQQDGSRRGLSAGRFDSSQGYKLAYNDPRAFKRATSGDQKRYYLVIVIDRSGSMQRARNGHAKIDIATKAAAKFTIAAEQLGIDVAVIDFFDDDARLAKPASLDAEYAKESLLGTATGGRTPLADALRLARTVTEARRSSNQRSLIISMTDDKPDDTEAVKEEIQRARTPVCSLTIATDCRKGNPPAKSQQLQSAYTISDTVFDPSELDERLDAFASLLGRF